MPSVPFADHPIDTLPMTLAARAYDAFFRKVHGSRLIYNTCWEDPRADRELLALKAGSRVLMITSAGCNALDYLLDDPAQIDCVDMNPRQNALLELKLAVLKVNRPDWMFALFGDGQHGDFPAMYRELRPWMSPTAQEIWDQQTHLFSAAGRGSFYFRGASGDVAYWVRQSIRRLQPKLWRELEQLIDAQTLDEQRERYTRIEKRLWGPVMRWAARQPLVLTMLGVPRAQRNLIETQYPGGMNAYIEDKLRYLLTELPIQENYFWRVYIYGRYTRECCPNYLKPENFQVLRERAERVTAHTGTMAEFLKRSTAPYDRFILLDHQDWMAVHAPQALDEEWNLVISNSAPDARVLMRSAGLDIDFLPEFARSRLLPFDSAYWHQRDRVGTYGSVLCAAVRSS